MRKIIVSMNVTLDGYMAGPDCELDWHFDYWNEEMAEYAGQQLSNADTILLGRVTYTAMAKYWPLIAADLSCPRGDLAFAELMNRHTKIVFSKTLQQTAWSNSVIQKQNMRKAILHLKQQPGKDMIIYGSGTIAAALTKMGLVDDYTLWVHPVVLGHGKLLFKNKHESIAFKLTGTKTFSSGVVVLHLQQAA